ncbi:acyltransferase family protein [Aliikangiella coralliicola]|uniref:Acyltransferase family protein n=1 Tax=Aliikangiella coralliicola TaxID=2592383 RepID=A0A545UHD8_9GAMM|nr:acyltransferase family protein [Aliikangiella coralliicola]TQV88891.1 acyltransferase family protein [Aliikangiella coralliicola]
MVKRIYYMDVMRSILMLLGIVLHASNVFAPTANWAISDTETSSFFDYLRLSISSFRMPTFFIISGFFCYLTLIRYGAKKFARVRLERILIPVISIALTFNILEHLVLSDYQGVNDSLSPLLTTDYWLSEQWVGHLWFLINLILYFFVAIIVFIIARKPLSLLVDKIHLLIKASPYYWCILLLPLVTYLTDFASYNIPEAINPPFKLVSSYVLFHYISFFVFGLYLATSDKLIKEFTKFRAFPFIALTASLVYLNIVGEDTSGFISKSIARYLDALQSWSLANICFILFSTFFNKDSKLFRYLSDASYSIYLFHHLLVIAFGILLIPLNLPIGVKFIILISSVGLVALSLHHFGVLRLSVARYLFNGKKLT